MAELQMDEAWRRARAAVAEDAKELHLGGLGLTTEALEELAPEIEKLRNLVALFLGLAVKPTEKHDLQLTEDDKKACNAVRTLPARILAALPQLVVLDLRFNQLTALPDAIGQCTALKILNLSGNQLTALPDAIGQCTALEHLYLGNNHLTALPDAIGQCTALKRLSLSHNRLTGLPDAIGRLTSLSGAAATPRNALLTMTDGLRVHSNPLPFQELLNFKQPAHTVEIINYHRQRLGLADYFPAGYENPDGPEVTVSPTGPSEKPPISDSELEVVANRPALDRWRIADGKVYADPLVFRL